MSREMQSFRIAASQSTSENVIYSNVRAERRSFMFNTLFITNNLQQKDSIFIDILKDLTFWITNDSVRVLKMIQQIRDETKKMNKKYNEQCDLIDELQNEKKFYKKELLFLRTTKLTISISFALWKKNWKFLRRVRIVFVMCENSSRHHSDHRLQIKRWLQKLIRRIDSRRQSDQSSFRIRQSLSKTKQNSSIDCRSCRVNLKRMSIDTQSSEWRWHM
jgi:hypothetical protein